jgi:hypothetical protein
MERQRSEIFFDLHWVLPYHALNSELANFETPCIIKSRSEFFVLSPEIEDRGEVEVVTGRREIRKI